ncbi:hypothetical protein PGT21_036851 [Puccinia graminis f. sp. tritici]|uniref:Uncharacterized protein n=1 Tax=Puccinia graminis f. sp. tritici TaxID=56615 RepID=A0A5B0Q0L9_PUCGR|nr:hypothetical protein PGT21_036851 [Puccinia graminis f. sp. tritici]KAA1134519.1 hypothetical protein PGTUg99_004862 [Puccinia graminis f. sp. tritici]
MPSPAPAGIPAEFHSPSQLRVSDRLRRAPASPTRIRELSGSTTSILQYSAT